MQRFFSKFLIIISLLALLYLNKSDESNACSYEYEEDYNTNILFSQNTLSNKDFFPLYFTNNFYNFSGFYYDEKNPEYKYFYEIEKKDNIALWIKEIGFLDSLTIYHSQHEIDSNQYSPNERYKNLLYDFEKIIYKSKIYELNEIQKFIENKTNKLNHYDANYNEVIKYFKKQNDPAFINYMIIAKKCESELAILEDNYDFESNFVDSKPSNTLNTIKIQAIISQIKKNLETESKSYLKLRYAFQLCKLYFYTNEYDLCLKTFDKNFNKKNTNCIYYWALGYKAGSELRLKDTLNANYHYSQIFSNCRSKSFDAHKSMIIYSQLNFDQLLNKCQNNKEKASIYALRGIKFQNDASVEIENVYKLDSNSQFIELLLFREISKLEYALKNKTNIYIYKNNDTNKVRNQKLENTNIFRLKTFVEKVIKEQKFQNIDFIQTVNAYLEYLSNNLENCDSIVNKLLNKKTLDKNLKTQLTIFKLAIKLEKCTFIDENFENEMIDLLDQVKYFHDFDFEKKKDYTSDLKSNLYNLDKTWEFCLETMSYKYYCQKDYAKSYLCLNSIDDFKLKPDLNIINQILELSNKQNKNEFEEYILKKSSFDRLTLIDTKGTFFLGIGKYQEAIEEFSKLSPKYIRNSNNYELKCDPFVLYFEGAYNFDFEKYSKTKYNKLSFAQQMIKLEHQMYIINNQDSLANIYIEYINALINTSYYGSCWNAMDFYHSCSFNSFDFISNYVNDYIIPQDMDYYNFIVINDVSYLDYKKIQSLFIQSDSIKCNENLKAKIEFLKAKLESFDNNIILETIYYEYYFDYYTSICSYLNIGSCNSFTNLKHNFSNTDFYKEAYNNCSYFRDYVDLY